jgi:microcompartment protein CcmL/EutN
VTVPEAVALLEIASLARGVVCADAAVKRAPVELLLTEAVSPGKYLLLFGGGVAEVGEALEAAERAAADSKLDRLWLPQVHPQVLPALRAGRDGLLAGAAAHAGASAGVVELITVAAAIRAADAACKAADVKLQMLHVARGIGGKAWFVVRGALADVEAAVSAAQAAAGDGLLAGAEIIPRPHSELRGRAL